MGYFRCPRLQQLPDPLEFLLGDDGGESVFHPHRLLAVSGPLAPDQSAGVGFVGEEFVDGGLAPLLAVGGGDALGVESLEDVQGGPALEGEVEDAADHGVVGRVQFQAGTLLGPVLDIDPLVPVGGAGIHPETPGGRLAHTPRHFLGQILRVELVHGLDDGLHELAGGGVVGVLGDGYDADALAPQHGLEGHGVLPLAGEPRKLPDQDFLEGRVGLAGFVQHLAELGSIGDPAALGLVHVLADGQVAVLLGVVSKGAKLGGNGEVHVLAVAGNPGVEGRRYQVVLLTHCSVLHLALTD